MQAYDHVVTTHPPPGLVPCSGDRKVPQTTAFHLRMVRRAFSVKVAPSHFSRYSEIFAEFSLYLRFEMIFAIKLSMLLVDISLSALISPNSIILFRFATRSSRDSSGILPTF